VGSLLLGDVIPPTPLALVLLALPSLVLLVRASVLAFQAAFRRSQGAPPPELLASLVSFLLYALGAGLIAHTWFGFELTPFLATSAVVGAVVGLALQETLGNLIAGIALHTEAPFRVGDWVQTAGREGAVEQISWRATRLRTLEGDTVTIPNNEVARHAVLNYSLPPGPHSRVLSLSASLQVPPNQVIAVLGGLLREAEGVLQDPAPRVLLESYRDASAQYQVRYFTARYEDSKETEAEILRLVWYHFHRHGIAIPPASHEVFVHTVTPPPGDAQASRLEAALRGIDLFRTLDEEAMGLVVSRFRKHHYGAGERIIEEGSSGDSFFIVDRGEVEVRRSGRRKPLARLAEGQFFGEMALLTGERRNAEVVAVTDVDLFTIDKAGFQDVIVAHPSIAGDISAILAERRESLARDEPVEPEALAAGPGELKDRILDRIRDYFGL
jgi:small-conductance mechanosensitive channel